MYSPNGSKSPKKLNNYLLLGLSNETLQSISLLKSEKWTENMYRKIAHVLPIKTNYIFGLFEPFGEYIFGSVSKSIDLRKVFVTPLGQNSYG